MICPLCHRSFSDPTATFCGEDGTLLVDAPPIRHIAPRLTEESGAIFAGRYEVKGLLGHGGLAKVYLGWDTQTGEPVAIKVLDASRVKNVSIRERFMRENEIASKIGHPNIVRILDAGQAPDKTPFIVYEYLEGESVGDMLGRVGRVSEDFALTLLARAASALVAAHAAGIVHRDLKPDNLYLVSDGSILKVLDFGMAKLQEGAFTAAGILVGTVPYMAPEQATGDRVDGRTDVYGLGITLYKMVTGRLPFSSHDDATLVAHHLFTPVPPPSTVYPEIDPRVERIILTATRKLPGNRYPSMRAMLEDMGRILGERSGDIAAPEPTLAPDVYEPENPLSKRTVRLLRSLVP